MAGRHAASSPKLFSAGGTPASRNVREFFTVIELCAHGRKAPMKSYMCVICGFVYNEADGLPEEGIAPRNEMGGRPSELDMSRLRGAQGRFRDGRDLTRMDCGHDGRIQIETSTKPPDAAGDSKWSTAAHSLPMTSRSARSRASSFQRLLSGVDDDDDIEAVRIYVAGGGCAGMTYGMTFTDRRTGYDRVYEGDGLPRLHRCGGAQLPPGRRDRLRDP